MPLYFLFYLYINSMYKENLLEFLQEAANHIKQKNLLLAYEKIKNSPLNKKLLVAYFRLTRDLG